MTIQRLYDLLAEAEWKASEGDLDHCVFLIESFPGIEKFRAIIQADFPRIQRLLDPPQSATTVSEALMRCMQYIGREGYSERLAQMLLEDRGTSLMSGRADQVVRKTAAAGVAEAQPVTEKSIAQRLYELICATDALDTDFHIEQVAEMLHK